uniref:Uncharacterized protein n=1 Tax=Tanacetum cinerariifolium TaxID=118510 RepID=A0A6L2LA76_TANCI|nr:hypothetical protein [Tanacetum cinerariifolium]
MADKEKKSTMKGFATNDQAYYYSGITSITVNGKNAYELKGKFLDDLHNNAFSGINEEDAIEHIEYFLKIIDPIDLPNVNQDKLRVVIFPISLVGDAWRCDEVEPTNENTFNFKETKQDDEQEIGKIFKIETNLFDYETSLCEKFKEFNYLLKIDSDVLTNDIVGFKTYDEYKDPWIYEWNKNVSWVHKKPWADTGVWTEPTSVLHCCKPFNYKNGCSEWLTYNWREDGYCNRENLPRAYIVGNTLRYQDLEWCDALKDSNLKEEALRNKAIMEGLINEDVESNNEGWKSWDEFKSTNGDRNEWEYESEHEDDERYELCDKQTHELPVCNIRRFEMIKYSFRQDEEYVVVKEYKYEDLTSTSEDTCLAYQEIFRIMDEG